MATREQCFVLFISPGTFFAEQTERPIETLDPARAVEMSKEIVERYDARPYAFQFITRLVADPVDDGRGGKMNVQPKTLSRSGNYFIGGKVITYDQVAARNRKDERILRSNMESPDHCVCVENTNSWKATLPFGPDDVIVNESGEVVERGNDKKYVRLRKEREDAMAARA